MKNQVLLIIILALSTPCLLKAQYIYKIKADSVRIYNDSCTAELILENRTKDTVGFLFNKGNGRTEFRRALIPLGGMKYLIGRDTLDLGSGNISVGNLITVTKAQADTLISTNSLIPGELYKIFNRGDRGIFLRARTTNKMAEEGIRLMLCPKTYQEVMMDGNNWRSQWQSTRSYVINDLVIYYGFAYKNLTGNGGSEPDSDTINWQLISKTSFTNNEYVEREYGVFFDWNAPYIVNDDYTVILEKGQITKQWDGYDNIIYSQFLNVYANTPQPNNFDQTDWNINETTTPDNPTFTNKRMWGNRASLISWNPVNNLSSISNNRCYSITRNIGIENIDNNEIIRGGSIEGNTCISNNGWIIGNKSYEIYENVLGDENAGSIRDNYVIGYLSYNNCSGGIIGNRCGRDLQYNSCATIADNIITGGIDFVSGTGIQNQVGSFSY